MNVKNIIEDCINNFKGEYLELLISINNNIDIQKKNKLKALKLFFKCYNNQHESNSCLFKLISIEKELNLMKENLEKIYKPEHSINLIKKDKNTNLGSLAFENNTLTHIIRNIDNLKNLSNKYYDKIYNYSDYYEKNLKTMVEIIKENKEINSNKEILNLYYFDEQASERIGILKIEIKNLEILIDSIKKDCLLPKESINNYNKGYELILNIEKFFNNINYNNENIDSFNDYYGKSKYNLFYDSYKPNLTIPNKDFHKELSVDYIKENNLFFLFNTETTNHYKLDILKNKYISNKYIEKYVNLKEVNKNTDKEILSIIYIIYFKKYKLLMINCLDFLFNKDINDYKEKDDMELKKDLLTNFKSLGNEKRIKFEKNYSYLYESITTILLLINIPFLETKYRKDIQKEYIKLPIPNRHDFTHFTSYQNSLSDYDIEYQIIYLVYCLILMEKINNIYMYRELPKK